MTLQEYCYERSRAWLEALDPSEAGDTYVVSFFLWNEDQDPRFPAILLDVNTETQVSQSSASAVADPAEVRWNYAFWRQEDGVFIASRGTDTSGAELRRQWAEESGTWVDDAELASDPALWARASQTAVNFEVLVATVARQLHRNGVIATVFGRPIPTIVHELEYGPDSVEVNRAANPAGLVDEFEAWVGG
jgi:hypothetical protein